MRLVEQAVLDGHGLELCEKHIFADGTYTRSLEIPAGVLVVGKVHKVETVNICAKGEISILTARGARRFKAGEVVISAPGIQKIGVAHSDTIWINVFHNPENIRDIAVLEEKFARDPWAPPDLEKFMLEARNP